VQRVFEDGSESNSTCFVAPFQPLHLVCFDLRLDYAQHCERYISSKRVRNLCGLYTPQTPPAKLVVSPAPSPAPKLTSRSGDPLDISPRLPEEYALVYINNRRSKLRNLPKGRKDINESIAEAALRETFEETGYKCSNFLPLPAPTLAPAPGTKPMNRPIWNTEAVAIRLWPDSHSRKAERVKVQKFVHWYVAEVDVDEKGVPVPRVEGTQLPYEQYDVCEMSLEQACREEDGLSLSEDRLMIAFVLDLLTKRYHILTSEANSM
jgi:8-oxo-dGTP pyrophosphatase MutT (NUDIX family)